MENEKKAIEELQHLLIDVTRKVDLLAKSQNKSTIKSDYRNSKEYELKRIVSTLPLYYIDESARRTGRTTRQVNEAIDSLFEGCRVIVRDHAENGNMHLANKDLLKKIIRRLEVEHGIKEPDVFVNEQNVTIEFINK